MLMLLILLGLVVVPALIGFRMNRPYFHGGRSLSPARVRVGDAIVYCKNKASTRPGARAHDVHPSERGDSYYYLVDKYWTVADVLANGLIVAKTRTNKHHYLSPDDPNLRRAGILEHLRHRQRFPRLAETQYCSRSI